MSLYSYHVDILDRIYLFSFERVRFSEYLISKRTCRVALSTTIT